jgi:fatty-acid desaturase
MIQTITVSTSTQEAVDKGAEVRHNNNSPDEVRSSDLHLAKDATATAVAPQPRPATCTGRIFWPYAAVGAVFHSLLPLAFVPWLFSWTGLLLIPLGNYIFCSLGIGLCFHRTLTHRGLELPKWLERSLAILGVCSLIDPPARWVAIHRLHHQHSDTRPDPHSPRAGFLWSHFKWLLNENLQTQSADLYDRYARDVLRDPFYFRLERHHFWVWVYAMHAALFFLTGLAIGWATGDSWLDGVQFGLSLLLWGVVYRTIYSWHITGAVNSVAHLRGYRNYPTDDTSTNHWLVALATNGEGWHNHHHAHPVCARHGHRWWELDLTYLTIRALESVGLARQVKDHRVGYMSSSPSGQAT